MERISTDAGTQFISAEFQDKCQTCGFCLKLAAPEHQEMKMQVEVKCRTFRMIAHSLMVHARVLEVYIHFELIYTADIIFPGTTNQRLDKQRWRDDHAI